MPTANYYVKPQDGWVQIATAPKFVRVSAAPHTHPFYLAAGSSAPSLIAIAGTGTITFTSGVPTAGQTITIGSEVYTFRASASLPFEVTIGATNLITATNFTTIVNSQSTLVTASDTTGVVTVTAIAIGAQGNYSLAKTAANVTLSGAAMTGGTDVTLGILTCHHPFKVNVTMTENLYARVVKAVADEPKNNGSIRLDVFTI